MPVTINVGYSEKLGQPDFGSIGASCHIECELDGRLVFESPEAFQEKVRELYAACSQATKDELARHRAGNGVSSVPCKSSNGAAPGVTGTWIQDREIHHPGDLAGRRRNLVDLLLIGLRDIEVVAYAGRAIGCSIGLEVVRVGVRNRMGHQVLAAVCHRGPGVIGIDSDDAVRDVRHTMRTAGARHHRI